MKLIAIAVPLALAACNNQPGQTTAKVAAGDVEARMTAALKMQPGNWATNFRIVAMEMAGTKDPKAAEAIQQAMAAHGTQASAYDNCISLIQAKKPLEIVFAGTDVTGCRYDSFSATSGKISAKMTCKRGKGTMTRTMSGTFSPTAYALTTVMTGDGTTEATALTMKTQTSATRTGDCPVDTKNTV